MPADSACRVLIVEDDDSIRETLMDALQEEGHAVLCARDGFEALRLLGEGPRPGIILLDLMLPVMSGWEFAQRLGRDEALAQIPIVVVSAIDAQDAAQMRARAVVPKPFDLDELLSVIDTHCCCAREASAA